MQKLYQLLVEFAMIKLDCGSIVGLNVAVDLVLMFNVCLVQPGVSCFSIRLHLHYSSIRLKFCWSTSFNSIRINLFSIWVKESIIVI